VARLPESVPPIAESFVGVSGSMLDVDVWVDEQDDISDKTKANMKSCLHDFWSWLLARKVITADQFPSFPKTPFELGWRNITDIPTQQSIIEKVKDLSYHINPKIWLGIKWLSVYGIRMRPGEMLNLKEADVNLNIGESGAFIIPHPKEKKPKIIYLIDEDYRLLKDMPRGLPDLYFFRHPKGIKGCQAGQRFGNKYFYKWWKRACKELGIEGLDLYGGTKHTTVTAANARLTPEQIKLGTGHATNKAFERYFQREARDAVQVYETINDLQHTYNRNKG
jgi:integrase